ncbi:MAG: hypothetical protein J6U94_02955 [Paludibacteraceae bacterium]|nr:hypothetical protein [Paludibacteraceae bacterium]
MATPLWKLNTNNAHEDLATWAKELIETKINQLPDGEYTFTLNQKDDAMTIHYDVVDKDIQGEQSTEYAWEGLESLVGKVFTDIKQQIKNIQSQKAVALETTEITSPSQPNKEEEKVDQHTSVKSKENKLTKQLIAQEVLEKHIKENSSKVIDETNNKYTKDTETSPEDHSKSYIYIRRPFQYMGAGLNHFLEVNGELIGNLTSGGCLLIVTDPGYITIKDYYGLISYDKLKNKGKFVNISVDVNAGEKVYFKMNEALLKYEKEVDKENKYEPQTTIRIK